jgi:hypothetical protein
MVLSAFVVIGWQLVPIALNRTCLLEFNVDPTVDGQSVEVVLLDYFLKESGQQYFHVFKPWQRGAKIIVFNVHHHHGCVLGGEGAVD